MKLNFMPSAAAAFARLDEPSAGAVVAQLAEDLRGAGISLIEGDEGVAAGPTEFVRHVAIPTRPADLWVGAFAEGSELTLVTLNEEKPPKNFHQHMEAVRRATRRLALGGVSLEAPTADIQNTLRALLEEQQAYYTVLQVAETEGEYDVMEVEVHKVPLVSQLLDSAHRWGSTLARQDFKTVMEKAAVAPQVVEREGRQVLVIDSELLERFEQPLSGAALAARFRHNTLAPLKFAEATHTEPNPTFELRPLALSEVER